MQMSNMSGVDVIGFGNKRSIYIYINLITSGLKYSYLLL